MKYSTLLLFLLITVNLCAMDQKYADAIKKTIPYAQTQSLYEMPSLNQLPKDSVSNSPLKNNEQILTDIALQDTTSLQVNTIIINKNKDESADRSLSQKKMITLFCKVCAITCPVVTCGTYIACITMGVAFIIGYFLVK